MLQFCSLHTLENCISLIVSTHPLSSLVIIHLVRMQNFPKNISYPWIMCVSGGKKLLVFWKVLHTY